MYHLGGFDWLEFDRQKNRVAHATAIAIDREFTKAYKLSQATSRFGRGVRLLKKAGLHEKGNI